MEKGRAERERENNTIIGSYLPRVATSVLKKKIAAHLLLLRYSIDRYSFTLGIERDKCWQNSLFTRM